MLKVAILSANCGSYDLPGPWPELAVPDGVSLSVHRLDDSNFPPRPLAMTSRLQCGIPKWCGTDFASDADVIIWIDASCAPTSIAVPWFLEQLGGAEIAVFAHPERATVREEYEFIKARMARPGERYLNSRYKDEWIDEQFRFLEKAGAADLPLYASTAFVYRIASWVRQALRECLWHKMRYLLHDQLIFPWALLSCNCDVRVIQGDYLHCPALTFVRKRKAG